MSKHGTALTVGQFAEFSAAVIKALPRDIDPDIALGWASNGKALTKVLAENLCPPTIGIQVYVDRSIRPVKPERMMLGTIHPAKLENTGPAEYNLADVELWLHECQKHCNAGRRGFIHRHLENAGMLKNCLSLRDGEEIKKLGIVIFRKFFGDKSVFLWKSVMKGLGSECFVPILYDNGGRVVICWRSLEHSCGGDCFTALLAS